MSKAEIIDLSGIESEDYPRMVEELLVEAQRASVKLDRVRGQRGGFEVVADDGTQETGEITSAALEPWQQAAVEVLADLDPGTLEELAGRSLYNAVRRLAGRRGRHPVATAIVLRHGVDLLADTDIREALAKKKGIEAPARWVAGGQKAQQFSEALGLPFTVRWRAGG